MSAGRIFVAFIAMMLVPCVVFAQQENAVSDYLEELIDDGQVSGGVVIVTHKGETLLHEARGTTDTSNAQAVRKDAIFRTASMTKPITNVVVLMLIEEGKLAFDDEVVKWIPGFTPKVLSNLNDGKSERAHRNITVLDLLRHTSGLTYASHPTLGQLYKQAGITTGCQTESKDLSQMISVLAELPLAFHPGEDWQYGMSSDVLGLIIETVEGDSLGRVFQSRVFGPLGMVDRYIKVPAEKRARVVGLNFLDDVGKLRTLPDGKVAVMPGGIEYSADFPYNPAHSYFSGGGSVCSTAEDFMNFCQMLLGQGTYGSQRLLSPTSVKLMTTNQIGKHEETLRSVFGTDSDDSTGFGYSLILDHAPRDGRLVAYRWGGAFSTYFIVFPDEDAAIVVMLQTAWNENSMAWKLEFKKRAAELLANSSDPN